MRRVFGKFEGKKLPDVIKEILSSHVFPFFTASLVMLCYYLGWDMVTICYLGIVTLAMVLLLDDLTPLVSHLFFFSVIISKQHTPSEMAFAPDPGYFMRPANLALIGILLVLIFIAIILRFVTVFKEKKFKPTPVFCGICALACAFLLNGIGKQGYSGYDFLYGLIMAAVYVVIFALIACNVKLCEENYRKICFGFLALSLVLVIELFAIYISNRRGMLNEDGEIIKEMVVLGWGIWNTVGMMLVICIPPIVMLSTKYEYGFGFIFYATLLAVAAFLTTSRQAMVGAAVIYPCSLILAVIKSKNRTLNLFTIIGILAIGTIVVIAKWDKIIRLLGSVFDNMFDENGVLYGNGRMRLIKVAMQFFIRNPLFGSGLFLNFQENDFTGLQFVPEFACNTFAEILASCGIVGFVTYILHRVQTFVYFAKNPTFNKTYIALIISGLLIISLFDNHMFNILPNLIYSSLLPFALGEATECRAVIPLSGKKKFSEENK